ncbi:hypothetical protein J4558_00045 [Leptolyngbya sp. 15MV]|nr:hypothetical protein J4558_00045 [Leptolyngbya sp. 15MV]
MRATYEIARLNGGEVSPWLQGRVDLERYRSSLRLCLNMIPLAEGAITRRPGTRFVAEVPGLGPVRAIEFQFATGDAYVFVFVSGVFHVFANRAAVLDGLGAPLTVAHPYSDSQLPEIDYCQSADLLLLFHRQVPVQAVRRTAPNAFTVTAYALTDGPYELENVDDALTIDPSATTGTITLTASAPVFDAARDVGRWLRLRAKSGSALRGVVRITAVTSATVATGDVQEDFPLPNANPTSRWQFGAFYTGNHPGTGTFYQQRLYLAGTPARPQTFWGSRVGEFNRFSPSEADGSVTDASGLSFTVDDDEVNEIRWLAAVRALLLGTSGGLFSAQASRLSEAITPTNITVTRMSTTAVARRTPARVNGQVFAVNYQRNRVHEIAYDFSQDQFVMPELSLLARHLMQDRIAHLAWQDDPWRTLWCVRDDGALLGCTYLRDQDVRAWHRHDLGGAVEAAAVVREDQTDDLWLVVRRSVAGAPRRYVEYLGNDFLPDDPLYAGGTPLAEAGFSDSALAYAGPPVTALSGLAHLRETEVDILVDGATHPRRTVTPGGALVLDRPGSRVTVGVPIAARLETLSVEIALQLGTTKGRPRTSYRVTSWFVATGAGHRIGPHFGPLDTILTRGSTMPMDAPAETLDGPVQTVLPGGVARDLRIVVACDKPTPLTIASLTLETWMEAG